MAARALSSHGSICVLALSVAWLVSGCVMPGEQGGSGAGGSSDGGGGGGAGPTGCDARSTCSDCAMCASEGECAQLLAVCQDNPVCVGLDECMLYCQGDVDCDQMCRMQNPGGIDDWDRAASCIYCDVCETACSGSRFCG
jgi:hypothetical protein